MLMKFSKKLVAIVVLIAFAVALIPFYSHAADFPVTVKDGKGYSITVKQKPQRILSLALQTDEILLNMVSANRIVGLSIFADDKNNSNVVNLAKNVKGRYSSNDIEKIIAAKPDLVIVPYYIDKSKYDLLKKGLKCPIYVSLNPNSIVNIKQEIINLSKLTGEIQKGQALIKYMDDKINFVQKKVKYLRKKKYVLFYTYYFNSTYGKNTTQHEIAKYAGVINIAAVAGLKGWPTISKEQILEWDPNIIVIPSASYNPKKTSQQYVEEFKKDPAFKNLKAVKNNSVIILDDRHVQTVSHYIVEGIYDLAKAAYPYLFK
ncbi:periplasmic binding protein [Caldicellulosiruptor hydrothermalis 108]|uniref:Periplasmic binding protein n=1 Tax=Caldicellulosiruptor hydrothermalis (strain DSM 18901 / VKM B-2411 / 108) TaxID=632292 RepID=E4Q7A4_CALH1|nr:ABC transporter substrate-binding protein [Caldicellulosiruptor hydrothermalis]ADQ06617.1 periplasmic binding protein [Caldicellulosiruptor hydrothermalis 108]